MADTMSQCEDCGATAESPAKDCCDTCIIAFFTEDANAPDLDTMLRNYESLDHYNEDNR